MLNKKQWEFLAKGSTELIPKKEEEVFARFKKKKPEPLVEGLEINKNNLWQLFSRYYRILNNKDFEREENAIKNVEPIFKYFLKDSDFMNSDRVVKKIAGSELRPSLEKGLLIIGGTGNGKTTIMETFFEIFKSKTVEARECRWNNYREWDSRRFTYKSTADIAIEFSSLGNDAGKKEFFKKYGGFRFFFDDLMREKKGNNYGSEIFTDIIALRYRNKATTYFTMNYTDIPKPEEFESMSSLDWTLYQLSLRYGSHIYDRLFEMFNFIEFKGKSMRK